jgi:hypothetical protein
MMRHPPSNSRGALRFGCSKALAVHRPRQEGTTRGHKQREAVLCIPFDRRAAESRHGPRGAA